MNTESTQLAAVQADLRASLRQQIEHADDILSQIEAHRKITREAWTCMARTVVSTSALPELELETLDVLTELIEAADRMREHVV